MGDVKNPLQEKSKERDLASSLLLLRAKHVLWSVEDKGKTLMLFDAPEVRNDQIVGANEISRFYVPFSAISYVEFFEGRGGMVQIHLR
jgi:hypothetical protein